VTTPRLRAVLFAALGLGGAARLVQAVSKPLWADEIFTLALARMDVAAIVETLRADSGGPLHYIVAKAVLLPFGLPGPHDLLVRLLSVAASLLHLPLLVLAARRLGRPSAGLPAAALYSLFPLAIYFGAEGRAYVFASLLSLAAFERALAVREDPTPGRAAALALASGLAVHMHYLAVFPVAGLLVLLPGAPPRARRALVAGGLGGALLFMPWLLVVLRQPLAALAWARSIPFEIRLLRLPATLLGFAEPERPAALAVLLAVAALAALAAAGFRGSFAPAAGVLVLGLALFLAASLRLETILRPGRSVFFFLPFVALLAAAAPRPAALLLGLLSAAAAPLILWSAHFPSANETLAGLLTPLVSRGARVAVAGLPALEIDYRLARAGFPGRVVAFPSDVARHPGWYEEGDVSEERLGREARALAAPDSRPGLWVLPHGLRASAALRAALAPLGPRRLARLPEAEILLASRPSRGRRLDLSPDP
jgi:hypothetical protein